MRGLAQAWRSLTDGKENFTHSVLFLAPALLVIATFVLYPIGAVFYYSFTKYNISTPPVWVGLEKLPNPADRRNFLAGASAFIHLLAGHAHPDRPVHDPGDYGQPETSRHQRFPGHLLHPRHQRQYRGRHLLALDAGHQRTDEWFAALHWGSSNRLFSGLLNQP